MEKAIARQRLSKHSTQEILSCFPTFCVCLYVYPLMFVRQLFGTHVPVAETTHAIIEELLFFQPASRSSREKECYLIAGK
jgi:hypothetical protein